MFAVDYQDILAKVDSIDPIAYGKTRNYLDGKVTCLSAYISRGVISTKQIAESVLNKGYDPKQIDVFLKELAWRDYFQQVWMAIGDQINQDIKQSQEGVSHLQIPCAIVNGKTGIKSVDQGIARLYQSGYMHNHTRMFVASLCCNLGKSHWLTPAKWMYYHLLDADWASNALSWQWVAGSFSSKKYFVNQETINRFSGFDQEHTFLDCSYEDLKEKDVPKELEALVDLKLSTDLPKAEKVSINPELPTFIYNFYNLDPKWGTDQPSNRVLLLEPSFFQKYPVSPKTIDFILQLTTNIEEIQVVLGEFDEVFDSQYHAQIHYKEHPTVLHYKGTRHERDWMFEKVSGFYPSFFKYWKSVCNVYFGA